MDVPSMDTGRYLGRWPGSGGSRIFGVMSGAIFSTVLTLAITGASLFFVFRLIGGLRKQAREQQRLLQTGTPATGQILAVNQTGTYVNNQPQVNIVVMVHPPGGQPYQAQLTKIVSLFETAQYQVGAQVHVRFDPQDRSKIAVVTQGQVMAANPAMMMQNNPAMAPHAAMGGQPMAAQPMAATPMAAQPMAAQPVAGQPMAGQAHVPAPGALPGAGYPPTGHR